MYTEKQLMDKKPKELLEIVLELQTEIQALQDSLQAFSANQVSEELVKRIIRVIVDDNTSVGKLKSFLELVS